MGARGGGGEGGRGEAGGEPFMRGRGGGGGRTAGQGVQGGRSAESAAVMWYDRLSRSHPSTTTESADLPPYITCRTSMNPKIKQCCFQ